MYLRARTMTRFWLACVLTLSIAASAEAKSMDREEYRRRVIETCMKGFDSELRIGYCECCADEGLKRFTPEELKENAPEVKRHLERNVYPFCFEAHLDAADAKAAEATQKLLGQASKWDKMIPSPAKKTKPKPAVASPSPAPEPQGPPSIVYLTNGQTMECRITGKDAKGIWVEYEGMKVYFSNSEIKKIEG